MPQHLAATWRVWIVTIVALAAIFPGTAQAEVVAADGRGPGARGLALHDQAALEPDHRPVELVEGDPAFIGLTGA